MPSSAADFGTRLVSVKPGTVLISMSWKLLLLSFIRSTLPHPSHPKDLNACQQKSLSVVKLSGSMLDKVYLVNLLRYFAS